MVHIILGLFIMALGVWGLYDEYYYVVDFLKGSIPLILMAGGLLATLAGFVPLKQEEEAYDE